MAKTKEGKGRRKDSIFFSKPEPDKLFTDRQFFPL